MLINVLAFLVGHFISALPDCQVTWEDRASLTMTEGPSEGQLWWMWWERIVFLKNCIRDWMKWPADRHGSYYCIIGTASVCLSISLVTICCHASVIFRLCSREAMCQEEKKMPVLQAANPRAGERVPLQRLRQQGQTHSAVSPPESDGPVRCLPTHVLYPKKHKLYINLSPLCHTWIRAVTNSNLERSCEGTTLLQLGFRGWGDCYFTHSRCSSSVATLWRNAFTILVSAFI